MHKTSSFTMALAAALAVSGASADTDTQAVALPSFDTATQHCEAIPGYDPQWASHGLDYGADQPRDDGSFISGFFQIAGDGQHVYAAFGGALKADRTPAGSSTPGALVVLDADTLALQRFIPLPFHGYALSLQPAQGRAIVSHTRARAFSIVDLANGQSHCINPDTQAGERSFRNRYVTSDAEGNFYVSYYSGWGEGVRSTIAKFDGSGTPVASFKPPLTENVMGLPAFHRNGRIYAGGQSLLAVDAHSGAVQRILPQNKSWSIYNYAQGPGDTLLAANYQRDASPNLWLVDPATNSASGIFTGTTTLEAAYVPEGAQVFTTNFLSRTVTVAELPAGGGSLDGRRFVNLPFEGGPLGLYARRTARGTEAFVTTRLKGEVIHKITIAASVKGLAGIEQAGACTVTRFDLKDQSVSAPQPCEILDAQASYAALQKQAEETIQELETELHQLGPKLETARAELAQARKDQAGDEAIAELQKQVEALEDSHQWFEQDGLPQARANQAAFARLAGG